MILLFNKRKFLEALLVKQKCSGTTHFSAKLSTFFVDLRPSFKVSAFDSPWFLCTIRLDSIFETPHYLVRTMEIFFKDRSRSYFLMADDQSDQRTIKNVRKKGFTGSTVAFRNLYAMELLIVSPSTKYCSFRESR